MRHLHSFTFKESIPHHCEGIILEVLESGKPCSLKTCTRMDGGGHHGHMEQIYKNHERGTIYFCECIRNYNKRIFVYFVSEDGGAYCAACKDHR